jgi:hypothetical protein
MEGRRSFALSQRDVPLGTQGSMRGNGINLSSLELERLGSVDIIQPTNHAPDKLAENS